jgi:transposase
MMRLPDSLEQMLRQDNAALEGGNRMRYVTSVERLAFQKGFQQGLQKVKQKGEARIIQRQLAKRFGPLNAETLTRLQTATLEQLEIWAENLLDAATLDEVFKDN